MATYISHSPAETESLGEMWGRSARSGLVLALTGDLGAGKTRLVRGLARGLQCPVRVQSPSFTLVNVYEGGRLPLFHLDLYRLEGREAIIAAGLEDYFHPPGVSVVEWAERWYGEGFVVPGTSPVQSRPVLEATSHVRRVYIEVTGPEERRVTYEDPGY